MFPKNFAPFAVFFLLTAAATPGLADGNSRHDHDSHSHDQPAAFDGLVEDYLAIQTALAGDSIEGVDNRAAAIASSARKLSKASVPQAAGIESKNAEALVKILPGLVAAADDLSEARDIKAARAAFGPLSTAMIAYRDLVSGDTPNVAYCPMVKKNWLQNGKKVSNPYYGSSMLRCGSIVEEKSEGQHAEGNHGEGHH